MYWDRVIVRLMTKFRCRIRVKMYVGVGLGFRSGARLGLESVLGQSHCKAHD